MKKLVLCTLILYAALAPMAQGEDTLADWTVGNSSTPNNLRAVAFGNGRFVAVGEAGTIVTSPDGEQWTPQRSGTDSQLNGIVFGEGRFVAVGSFGAEQFATILTSLDGNNWTPAFSGTISSLQAVAYGNKLFVAVGGGMGNGAVIVTSLDGIHWAPWNWEPKEKDIDPPIFTGVTYGNGQFVAVFAGQYGMVPLPWVFVSQDGLEWKQYGAPVGIKAVTYGNGQFVGAGGYMTLQERKIIGYAVLYYSPEGITWTLREKITGDMANQFTSVAFGEGQFVAAGDRWTYSSIDGVNWVGRGDQLRQVGGLAYGNGRFVAVGAGGTAQRTGARP